jgi:group I intron endonuclease
MIIYKATNILNNKSYIGQTILPLQKRINNHVSIRKVKRCNAFHAAILKYGQSAFKWEILHTCNSHDELDKMEIFYIEKYNTHKGSGYNCAEGGKGTKGYKHKESTKKLISMIQIGKKQSESSNKKRSESAKAWLSNKENAENRIKALLEKRATPVYQYDTEMNLIKVWESRTSCKGQPGYNYSMKKGKHSYGFLWSVKPL